MRQQAKHLTAQQRESLERDGYLLVPSLLEETVLVRITSRLESAGLSQPGPLTRV